MKNLLALTLALLCVLSLFACSKGTTDKDDEKGERSDEEIYDNNQEKNENAPSAGNNDPNNCARALELLNQGKTAEAHALLYNLKNRTEEEEALFSKIVYLPTTKTNIFSDGDKEGISFTYDQNGNPLKSDAYSTGNYSCIHNYTYNADKTVTLTEYESDGQTVWKDYYCIYTYNSAGNLLYKKHYLENDELYRTNAYTYDEQGRLLIEETASNSSYQRTVYSYDQNGNILTRTFTLPDGSTQKDSYTYDTEGRLLTDESGTKYTYDANGRVLVEEFVRGEKVVYTYDTEGNCIFEERTQSNGNQTKYAYTYDEHSNLLVQKSTHSDGDSSERRYTYDKHGNCPTESIDGSLDFEITYTEEPFYFPNGIPAHIQEKCINWRGL